MNFTVKIGGIPGGIATLALAVASPAWAETVHVSAARMIDVQAGRVVENPLITITDGRISKVDSQYATVSIADNVEIQVQRQAIQVVLPKGTLKTIQ